MRMGARSQKTEVRMAADSFQRLDGQCDRKTPHRASAYRGPKALTVHGLIPGMSAAETLIVQES